MFFLLLLRNAFEIIRQVLLKIKQPTVPENLHFLQMQIWSGSQEKGDGTARNFLRIACLRRLARPGTCRVNFKGHLENFQVDTPPPS